ncbi:MAG: hypothetical protein K8963_04045, partial [Proteobacteria bacterium]|nr:hypothetical protein [Pseudomonadota bacterium]
GIEAGVVATTTATTTAFVATNAASETIPTLSPRTPLSLFAAAAGDIPTVPASGAGIEAGVVGGGVAVASGVGDQQDVDFAEGADVVEGLYPRFAGTWVGDPMPFFDGERWQIFYLNDQRIRRARGYHPWHRASTSDFFHYRDHGLVLAFDNNLRSRERALGTGSVIKVGELYHAFYTGHNPRLRPVEVIMHATSTDMVHWRKHPADSLAPPSAYSRHSFRDPHVLYISERNEYWMLITTRVDGDGVIARFVSDDLRTWRDGGVLFVSDVDDRDGNLEVPTLFKFGRYWYLVFSDQKPNRQTQYRMAESPLGPWRRPPFSAFDGAGFYAGKVVVADGRVLLAGWTPTKSADLDQREFMWAGNLVVHELLQNPDGTLRTVAPAEFDQFFGPDAAPVLHEGAAFTERARATLAKPTSAAAPLHEGAALAGQGAAALAGKGADASIEQADAAPTGPGADAPTGQTDAAPIEQAEAGPIEQADAAPTVQTDAAPTGPGADAPIEQVRATLAVQGAGA